MSCEHITADIGNLFTLLCWPLLALLDLLGSTSNGLVDSGWVGVGFDEIENPIWLPKQYGCFWVTFDQNISSHVTNFPNFAQFIANLLEKPGFKWSFGENVLLILKFAYPS